MSKKSFQQRETANQPSRENPDSPLFRLRSVSRIYRQGEVDVPALQGVSLEVQPGEFTAFVGPSGSGKTTLLNLMGALDRPTDGSVEFTGKRLDSLSDKSLSKIRLHRMGFVFQAYNLIPVFTAIENVEYILILQGEPEKGRKERCREILGILGMADLENRLPSQLSGGQQQRVAVARSIVGRPRVVLADEPTANLDSRTAMALLDHMRELNRLSGTTFLFSTHDARVMEKAGRIIHLEDGRIQGDEKNEPTSRRR